MWPRDIQMRANMTTSIWLDVEEMLSASFIAVEIAETGEPDLEDRLLSLLLGDGVKKAAGAVRWATVVGDDGHIRLALQGLPGSVELVGSKPSLRGDNVPTIELFSTPVGCRMFGGRLAAGPVPTLLIKANEDMAAINDNQAAVLDAIWTLADRLLRPEILGFQDATALLKKPREGKGVKGFNRQKPPPAPRPAKRPRATTPEPGRQIFSFTKVTSR